MSAAPDARRLLDGCGRSIDYLRLSVTDRCDLRCHYCMPKSHRGFSHRDQWLSGEEIERLVRIFAALGVRRVRLTGGEPLTRPDIVEIAHRISTIDGIDDCSLSTNATRLASFAQALREAGVSRLNVSLDTLDARAYQSLTGSDRLADVLDGLACARAAGFAPIKINMVALPGLAMDEVEAMVDYCIGNGFVLRLIEAMPMGSAGQQAGFLSLAGIERALTERYPLQPALVPGGGPARYLRHRENPALTVGFITPRSQHFCDTCNRVRVTVDGQLHLCLGHEDRLNLRSLLRAGHGDADIAAEIARALQRKPARHAFDQPAATPIRLMAATGG